LEKRNLGGALAGKSCAYFAARSSSSSSQLRKEKGRIGVITYSAFTTDSVKKEKSRGRRDRSVALCILHHVHEKKRERGKKRGGYTPPLGFAGYDKEGKEPRTRTGRKGSEKVVNPALS